MLILFTSFRIYFFYREVTDYDIEITLDFPNDTRYGRNSQTLHEMTVCSVRNFYFSHEGEQMCNHAYWYSGSRINVDSYSWCPR